jgi:hypothetical protein
MYVIAVTTPPCGSQKESEGLVTVVLVPHDADDVG